jgi:RHS repeat-associated protein
MKSKFRGLLFVFAFLLGVEPALAQVLAGLQTFGSFAGGPDTINLGNLNADWSIPIVNKVGRGSNFTYNLQYDSSVYFPVGTTGYANWVPVLNWGWQGLLPGIMGYANYSMTTSSGHCGMYGQNSYQSWTYNNLTFHDQHGVVHFFVDAGGTYMNSPGGTGCPPDTGAEPSGLIRTPSTDGQVYAAFQVFEGYMTVSFTDNHGSAISTPVYVNFTAPTSPSSSSTDSNGNVVSYSGGVYTDTLGQSALSVVTSGSYTTLSFQNNSGGYSDYTVNYTAYNIKTNFGCSGITEYSASSVPLVSSIVLPDGREYQFTYESTPGYSGYVTGRPASVTLPTGGTLSYTYSGGSNGIECVDGSTAGLTRTTPDGTWTYTRSGSGNNWTTTVTAPTYNYVQDQTVINFLSNGYLYGTGFYEIERQQYAGSASSGTLLETVLHCYESSNSLCSSTTGDTGSSVSLPIAQVKTTNQFPSSTGISAGTYDAYDAFGNNKSHAVYDNASGGTYGNLLQTTATTWSTAYNSIYGEVPTEVKVTDGVPTTLSDTVYTYTSTTTATSGTPQHASGAPTQDNLATVKRWVSGSTYQTTSYTYFDTGNVQTMTDPNTTGVTTYTYNSTGCANSLLTGTSTPVKNPAGTTTATLTTGAAWSCLGGVPNSTTDMNSNVTEYSYGSDPYWRPTAVTYFYSTGAATTLNLAYPTSSSNSSSSSMSFNGGSSAATTYTTYDSQGRPIITQTQQAPGSSNYDTVAVTYDSRGRSASQTLPYTASLGTYTTVPTQPGTTTTYDALNRQLQITDGGSGTKAYVYGTNTSSTPPTNNTMVTIGPAPSGENTKRRLLAHNGGGQLTSVCEITTLTGYGSCGTGSGQSGYLTLYTYDGPNLTKTQQNVQSGSNIQTRMLSSYDGLGRYASESIPEWSAGTGTAGASSYVYDTISSSGCTSSSAGDLVESTDNIGNVTCNTYDSMHRLLSSKVVSGLYSGTATPYSYFVYDAATYSGTPMQNAAGQLAEAYTCTGSCTSKLTDEFFSASPVTTGTMAGGVLSQMWESTPNSGGYFLTQDSYFPNGSVGAISASFGAGASSIGIPSLSFAVDGEGRPYSATDSTNSLNLVTATAYNSASLPTSITYGNAGNPSGSTSDVDSFTYDSNTYRPTYLTYGINPSSSPYSVVTQLTWNANSSLQQMAYTDGNDPTKNQTCSYSADDLSRIASVSCGTSTWAQNFSYDPFGNINKSVPGSYGGTAYAAAYSTVTNQVNLGITPAPTYDGNGNQKLTISSTTLTWNALNQPVSVNSTTATYDALGRMVEKGLSGVYTQFVYRPSGAMLAVYSGGLTKGTIPLPGGSTAVYSASGLPYIRHKDWLGSSRLATTWQHAVYSKEAYAPFGETYNEAGTPDRSFTGQDQNVATGSGGSGAYDFLFRKYDPSAGRWLSPDPSGWSAVNPRQPQSLNRYAYVQNNPLSLSDPNGLDCIEPDGSVMSGDCPEDANGNPTDDGVYVDCDGCVAPGSATFNDNGDITGYNTNSGGYVMVGYGDAPLPAPNTSGMQEVSEVVTVVLPFVPLQSLSNLPSFPIGLTGTARSSQVLAPLQCTQAQPLPSTSSACYQYGDETYLGVSLQCFCQCAGDSEWAQQVRGCLACAHDSGANPFVAHGMCYASGGLLDAPYPTLMKCTAACQQ